MEKKNILISAISKLIILALVFFIGFSVGVKYTNNVDTDVSSSESQTGLVSLSLDFGDGNTETFENVEISGGESVLDVLELSGADVSSRDFGEGMGVFIEAINGVGDRRGDEGKWWQFWVNGEYSHMGTSSYKINSGDSIEFKFTDERN